MVRFLKPVLLVMFAGIAMQAQQPTPDSPRDQSQRQSRRSGQEFRGVFGTISEISAGGLKLKRPDGSISTIEISPETQFRKDRQPAKLSDFKIGDNVAVRGESTGADAWAARMISLAPNPQEAQARFREGLGKQFVIGEIKTIASPKITLLRLDGVEQTIEADEDTSFKRHTDSITLPDLKAGDTIFARGELKNGVFVPSEVRVVDPEMAQRMKQRGGGMFVSTVDSGTSRGGNQDAQPNPKPDAPKQ